MIKLFKATDKLYATNGDLVLNPTKAMVHKEDNGAFYFDLETPLDEKEYKGDAEAGTSVEGTSLTLTDVDATKNAEITFLKGQTTQSGTPTPSSPQPINITTGKQVVSVCEKNLANTNNIYLGKSINSNDGTLFDLNTRTALYQIQIKPNTSYYVSLNSNYYIGNLVYYKEDKSFLITQSSSWSSTRSFTTPSNAYYISFAMKKTDDTAMSSSDIDNLHLQLELGSQTTYEEYKGNDYEINLGKNLFNEIYPSIVNNTTKYISLYVGDGTFTMSSNVPLPPNDPYASLFFITGQATSGASTSGNGVYLNRPITISSTNGYVTIGYRIYGGINPEDYQTQVEKGSKTSYSPYKTPIYLGKIGTYQDYIVKTSGKNLFDKDTNDYVQGYYLDNNGVEQISGNWGVYYIPVKPNTAYSISGCQLNGGASFCWFDSNKTFISRIGQKQDRENMVSPNNASYIGLSIVWNTSSSAYDGTTFMLNEGTTALPYEPYGEGQWYIHKEIGRVVLNGSENWAINSTYSRFSLTGYINDYMINQRSTAISNYYRNGDSASDGYFALSGSNNVLFLHYPDSSTNTVALFKTWLSSHNVELYYILNTPTTTLIEDEELINQLESIKLIQGLNNINVSSPYLPAILGLHYNFKNAYSNSIKYIDYLVPNNILVANTPQGEQAFRISNVEKTRRKIKIKANHVFYDSANLLIEDSYVVDKNCNDALDHLNSATSDTSPFTTISNVNHIDSYRCVRKSLYEAIQMVLERWGGHLTRNNWTLGIYDTIGQDNGVTIRYAKNLKDISATYDWNDVVTKLLPVGKDGILLNELDPDASLYVESATKYDIPYTKTVSFEQNEIEEDNFKDEDGELDEQSYKQALIDDLYSKATEYVTNNYLPKVNYTLQANVEKVSDVGDSIEVIDEKLGINIMTNIISYDYDCILERYRQLEFGNFKPTLSNLMTQISVTTTDLINENNEILQVTLGEELTEATDKIWNALGNSYVIYEGDKILVVDTLPKEAATNVIMINNGGIAFSNTGINGTFSSAWTIDNVLNMEQINVINLTADLIKGGTLKLGSNLNQNGKIEVFDEANTLIAELNKNGLKMYGADGSYVLMNNQVGFAGYDKNNAPIYWVSKDEFHMKNSVVEEEITLVGKMRILPITISNNGTVINDGIGFINVGGGE